MDKRQLAELALSERRAGRDPSEALAAAISGDVLADVYDTGELFDEPSRSRIDKSSVNRRDEQRVANQLESMQVRAHELVSMAKSDRQMAGVAKLRKDLDGFLRGVGSLGWLYEQEIAIIREYLDRVEGVDDDPLQAILGGV